MNLSLFVLTRNAGPLVCRAIDSMKNMPEELVIVDTGSTDNSRDVIRKFWNARHSRLAKVFEYTPKTHPKGFLLDTAETFSGGPVAVEEFPNWSSQPFLTNFGGARRSAWDRCTSKWATYLDSDDVWCDVELLPEAVAAAEAQDISAIGLPYIYRRDEHKNVICEYPNTRLTMVKGSTWKGFMHESLFHKGKSALLKDFGHVEDCHDLNDPGSRVHLRGWKALYKQYLNGDRNTGALFMLGMESRPVNAKFALDVFAQVIKQDDWNERRAKACYESGLLVEGEVMSKEDISTNDIQKAMKLYFAAEEFYSGHQDALYSLARIAFYSGDNALCIELTDKADKSTAKSTMQWNPQARDVWPKFIRARALKAIGNVDGAKVLTTYLRSVHPDEEKFKSLEQSLA